MMTRQQLLQELEVVPPFAVSLMRLTNMILSGDYTIEDVTKIVRLDQGLTIDVISYANSAESGPAKDITSVQEAIVRMGGVRIMRYLLSKWFRGNVAAALGSNTDSHSLWLEGVMAAVASDIIVDECPEFRHPAAFTTALLHDVGRVTLNRWAVHHGVSFDWNNCDAEGLEKETQVFGFNHAEVGAMILFKWNFPELIVEAVRFHGSLTGGPKVLADILRVANQVCSLIDKRETDVQMASTELAKRNNITAEKYRVLAERTKTAAESVLKDFGG